MDVGEWLRGLGLGQYEATFRDNAIDADILPDLTETDFEKLGLPLGHRKRLLKAIAGLAPGAIASAPVVHRAIANAAERRQVTVMFCDLVGSTAMSTRLDPEDLRIVIGSYHRCCAALVEQHGGFVAKYMGDGVLAYFGYPHAHEHDAERAVQAGLALAEAVRKLTTPTDAPLKVRIGIATGLVVVGDLVGSGDAQERGIVGETPNLAARLQGLAEPGRRSRPRCDRGGPRREVVPRPRAGRLHRLPPGQLRPRQGLRRLHRPQGRAGLRRACGQHH